MNDSASILLTSIILAIGGAGLYIYKSNSDNNNNNEDDNDIKNIEDDVSTNKDNEYNEYNEYNEMLDEFYDPPKKQHNRTKKQKYKKRQLTKRRY